jgi:hypothetical protein
MSAIAMMQLPTAARTGTEAAAPDEMQAACGKQKYHVLLALDGRNLSPELKLAALKRCVQFCNRLDILLLNSPKSPTFLLAGLLLRLEHSGIDYRLTSSEGDFGAEVTRYLQRYQSIDLVMVDTMSALQRCLEAGRLWPQRKACCYISLAGG